MINPSSYEKPLLKLIILSDMALNDILKAINEAIYFYHFRKPFRHINDEKKGYLYFMDKLIKHITHGTSKTNEGIVVTFYTSHHEHLEFIHTSLEGIIQDIKIHEQRFGIKGIISNDTPGILTALKNQFPNPLWLINQLLQISRNWKKRT